MVDVTTSKMAKKPVKLQNENQAAWAGDGKQSKGNQKERKVLCMCSYLTVTWTERSVADFVKYAVVTNLF